MHNGKYIILGLVLLGILISDQSAFAASNSTNSSSSTIPSNLSPPPYAVNSTGNPSSNSPSITVTTDKQSYTAGDTIIISGTTSNYLGATPLSIIIRNPIGNVVVSTQIQVRSDKTFSTAITPTGVLWQNGGTYSVYAVYGSASVSATTTFQFSGYSSNTSTNSMQNSPSQPTSTQSSQQQIQLTSSGTIDVGFSTNPVNPNPGSQTNLQISFINKNTNSIQPHIDYKVSVMEGNNQVFGIPITHTALGSVTIPVQLQDVGSYQVVVEVDGILFQPIPPETATFSISTNGQAQTSTISSVTITTDKSSYVSGEIIKLSGHVSNPYPGADVSFKVINPSGLDIFANQISLDNNGDFSTQLGTIPMTENGQYTIYLQQGDQGIIAQTQFTLSVSSPTTSTSDVSIIPGAGSDQSCVSSQNCFSPSVVQVPIGTTVTWQNNDKVGHTTTSGNPTDNSTGTVWDSSLIKPGGTYSFTFQNAGVYHYFCMVHPWMTGEVIVAAHTNPYFTPTPSPPVIPPAILSATPQDLASINQAKANQTIAAEVNVGANQSQITSIDNNVSIQTTQNTPDSLNVNVSASSQTGPKVIAFNLNATSINVANLKDLGVMYDGKLIQPASNMDAILHAKPTDNPSFAIVITQSGVQVLVLIPHFSTHTITITNMSKVISAIPEFGSFSGITIILSIIGFLAISRKFRRSLIKL